MSVVSQAVQTYYAKAREPKFDPTELRLSETGDCPRKRVLKALGFEPTHPISDEALRTMEAGKMWEDWLIGRICAEWPDVETQVVVETPYGASGHIDALLLGPVDPAPLIVEVKAINQWTPSHTLPKPEHLDQVMAYLHFYGRQHGIRHGLLVYIHRENGAGPFEHPITYDPEHGERIERDLAALRYTIDFGEGIGTPEGMVADRFPCSWTSRTGGGHCIYYGRCWAKAE